MQGSFEGATEGPARKYAMSANPRGICLIINNKSFANDLSPRHGTEFDKAKLQALFKALEFEVVCYDEVTDSGMLDLITRAGQRDHSQYNCFVCCILSHGTKGAVYGVNGVSIKIRKLTERVCPQSCPSLCGKPKVFLVQACQGDFFQTGHPETQPDTNISDEELIPNYADFLLVYSTVPGYVAYRNVNEGSYFIKSLVEALYKYAHKYDILSVLTHVNGKVGSKDFFPAGAEGPRKQSPAQSHSLRKRLYFSRTPLNARPHTPLSDVATTAALTMDDARRKKQKVFHTAGTSQCQFHSAYGCPPYPARQQAIEGDKTMAEQLQLLEDIGLGKYADLLCMYSAAELRRMSEEDMRKRIGLSREERATLLSSLAPHKPDSSRNASPESTSGQLRSSMPLSLVDTHGHLQQAANARGNRPVVGTYRHRDHRRFTGSSAHLQQAERALLLPVNVRGDRSRVNTHRHRYHRRSPFFLG